MKLHKDNRGMTLVEVMAAGLILTIALTVLATGFFTAARLLGDGDRLKNGGDQAEERIDAADLSGGSDSPGRVVIVADGTVVDVDGTYVAVEEGADGDIPFRLFRTEGNRYPSPLDMYQRMKGMPETLRNMSSEENKEWAQKLGIGHLYNSNDIFRNFMRLADYGNVWPEFPQESLPDALKGKTIYYQPFMANPPGDDADVVIFANEYMQNGHWNTRLIYDHECDAWYYRQMGSDFRMTSMNNTSNPQVTWEILHEQLHNDTVTWQHLE